MQKECLITLKKLENNIHLGKPLKNNGIRDLSNCYKLYFNEAKHRIVYIKEQGKIIIKGITKTSNVAQVVGIGERNNFAIYDLVDLRINKKDI